MGIGYNRGLYILSGDGGVYKVEGIVKLKYLFPPCVSERLVTGTLFVRGVQEEFIVRENCFSSVTPLLSLTLTVKVKVPDWVGVPERVPEEKKERPEGSVPPTLLHVYGGNPPVASNVYEYGWFCVPSGRGDVEVIVREEDTVGPGSVPDDGYLTVCPCPSLNLK